MPDEVGTEATRSDAPCADDSPFGDAADETPAAADGEQDYRAETGEEPESSGDAEEGDAGEEPSQDVQTPDDAGDDTAAPEDLKVVVSIKGGRASIGVQQPSSDPHIETFGDPDLAGLAQEVPAVVERAKAGWQESPKHPAYERPAAPARSRNRRQQGTAQNAAAETETEQAQQQTLKLF